MKRFGFIALLIIAMLAVAGCGNNNDTNNGETNNNANDNQNEAEENSSAADGEDQVLQLGETGTIKSTIGEYEVTPTSFVVADEWEGETPRIDGDVYVIIDIIITNIGDTVLEGKDLRKVDAIGGNDIVSSNNALSDKINELEGELQPGEEMEGQLAFGLIPTNTYKLVFGMHLGSVSNEITWELDADKAENK